MTNTENAGDGIRSGNASWTFGSDTPKNFSTHVQKSVPLYDVGHELVLDISDFFVRDNSVCYEIGVSTGVLIKKLRNRHKSTTTWIGIDKEKNMIEQAKQEIFSDNKKYKNIKLLAEDAINYKYKMSDFIVSYYTIQFIPNRFRQILVDTIYSSLNWGGAFLMFEKVRGPDARFQDMMTGIYNEFKLKQGYSPDEIISKARSLKGVMEPFSTNGNLEMLKRAGFVDILPVFKWVCFEGYVCIK